MHFENAFWRWSHPVNLDLSYLTATPKNAIFRDWAINQSPSLEMKSVATKAMLCDSAVMATRDSDMPPR